MSKPNITEFNAETNKTIVREMTDEEYNNYLIIIAEPALEG